MATVPTMTLLRPAWEVWTPRTADDRRAVLAELHKILASPHFCNSKRYPALLEYLVVHALDGMVDNLKERTLGIEVFHRPPEYDTNADTIVRYTAGEIRKRLALYYHEGDSGCPIQIILPVGSYVPDFLHAPPNDIRNKSREAGPAPPLLRGPSPFDPSAVDQSEEAKQAPPVLPSGTRPRTAEVFSKRSLLFLIAELILIAALGSIDI